MYIVYVYMYVLNKNQCINFCTVYIVCMSVHTATVQVQCIIQITCTIISTCNAIRRFVLLFAGPLLVITQPGCLRH